eukprot:3198339-Pyramimonas_sp.AAC.1
MHKAGRLHNVACRTNMTMQERTVRATRELNNTMHAADVTNFLQLIRAHRAGSGERRVSEHTQMGWGHS